MLKINYIDEHKNGVVMHYVYLYDNNKIIKTIQYSPKNMKDMQTRLGDSLLEYLNSFETYYNLDICGGLLGVLPRSIVTSIRDKGIKITIKEC